MFDVLKLHMRFALIALVLSLTACGGGGSGGAPGVAIDPVTDPLLVPEISLSGTAPNDNLLAELGTPKSNSYKWQCGVAVGSNSFQGIVAAVHDGDTITVNGKSIRLDSIDAPELKQTYGTASQSALAALVLNKPVTVTYTKSDKYGRIVGSVFTSDCVHVNYRQVATGDAWFYRAYQCEMMEIDRTLFAAAEESAQSKNLGLWGYPATPPWFYRNGVEPPIPVCSGIDPTWDGNPTSVPITPTTPTTPVVNPSPTTTPPPSTGCSMVWVNGYRRANGTWVSGYYRHSPGCA